jgi:hypothetical protein
MNPMGNEDAEWIALYNDECAELIALYNQATADIRAMQDRQTSLTQLAIALDAALLAFNRLVAPAGWVAALIFVVTVGAVASLSLIQAAIRAARGRVAGAEDHFSKDAFWKARGARPPLKWMEPSDTFVLMVAVLLIGGVLTWLALEPASGAVRN